VIESCKGEGRSCVVGKWGYKEREAGVLRLHGGARQSGATIVCVGAVRPLGFNMW
jgi:hypothetical protein